MISKLCRIWLNNWTIWILRLSCAALMLPLFFTQVDFADVLGRLSLVNIRLLVPVFILYFVIRYIWACQMSLGLIPLGMRFTVLELFKIILIAGFYSLVLPGNLVAGGAVSWYKLSRPDSKGIETGALLIYFRLINTLTLLGIELGGIWFDLHLNSPLFRTVIGAMLGLLVLLLLPVFFPVVAHMIERVGGSLLHRLPLSGGVQDKGEPIWKAMTAFQALQKRTIVLVIGLSLLSHMLGIVLLFLLALAIDIRLSFFVVGWIRLVLGMIHIIPISMAGLGVREVSLVLLLKHYDIPESQALTLSLEVFSITVIGGIVGGLLEGSEWLRGNRSQARCPMLEGEACAVTPISHMGH